MAKRHATRRRLSAGAALVTGLGTVGLGLFAAAPAQAATDLVYSCTDLGPQNFPVTLDTDAPETAAPGDQVDITPSGTVTLTEDAANGLGGAFQWEELEGDIPGVRATLSNGTNSLEVPVELSIPRTRFFDGDATDEAQKWPEGFPPTFDVTGEAQRTTVSGAGTYTISAPETFNATFSGFDASGEPSSNGPIESVCTYVSGDQVIDTVEVTEAGDDGTGGAPETNDWFEEPDSLPVVDNRFTVEGTPSQDGTLIIQVLDGGHEELTSYEWAVEASDEPVSRDFDLVEGADYVRILSQDCVDANGDDETVPESGCNVEYIAPWADSDTGNGDDQGTDDQGTDDQGTDDQGTDDQGGEDQGGDDQGTEDQGQQEDAADETGQPEVPAVVQTDGGQMKDAGATNAALGLGALLLLGTGAGAVFAARRRSEQG